MKMRRRKLLFSSPSEREEVRTFIQEARECGTVALALMNEFVKGFPIPPPEVNSRLEADYVEARRRENERNDVKHLEDKQNRSRYYAICNVVDDCRSNSSIKIAFFVINEFSTHQADPNCIRHDKSTPQRRQEADV